MTRLLVVSCMVLFLASCAPVQQRSFETNAIRAEIEAAHETARPEAEPTVVETRTTPSGADYNRERLTIEPIGMSVSLWSGGPFLGSSSGMSWRKWTAYRGFSLISEPDFFRVTGYEEEAEKAENHHTGAVMETVGGGLLAVIGLALLSNGYGDMPVDWTQARIGYLAAITGLALAWDGSVRMDQNWAPFDLANGIANQYNAELLRPGPDD